MDKYIEQAEKFLKDTNVKFTTKYKEHKFYFNDDKQARDVYTIRLQRGKRRFSFTFGQSIVNTDTGTEPSAYDVLSCLTKYDVGSFENFCSEFGCDTDSRSAEKVYKAVLKEYAGVKRIWTEKEIEKLQEIN